MCRVCRAEPPQAVDALAIASTEPMAKLQSLSKRACAADRAVVRLQRFRTPSAYWCKIRVSIRMRRCAIFLLMRRFLILFVVIQIVLFGVELLKPVQEHLVLPWTGLLADICARLVTLFDAGAASQGKVLYNPSNGFGVSIEPGCNGVEAMIVLLAAMLAFPAPWQHRLIGLGLGFLAIQSLNIVRVISLFYLGQWNMAAFRFAHEYLWQGLIMLDVLVVWLLWIRANPRRFAGSEHAPA